jgi:hypothetical protein
LDPLGLVGRQHQLLRTPVAPDGATGPPDLRELEVTPAHKVQ